VLALHCVDDGTRCSTTRAIRRATTSTHRSAENKQRRGLHRHDVDRMRIDATVRLIARPIRR